MDRRLAQVPDQNQDKGKAPQVPDEEHDQAWAQAPDQNQDQDKGKAPQVFDQDQDQDQDLDWDRVLDEVEFYDDDDDEDDDDDDDEEDDEEQALAADQVPNQDQVQPEAPQVPKKNKGRRKLDPTKKIENEAHLQVTFSKRRSGLFKKANELVILTAAELALIVFSPGNKAFSFGHPSLDDIIDRFLTRSAAPFDPTSNLAMAQQSDNVRQLNDQLKRMQAELEAERQKKVALDHARAVSRIQRPWEAPIEEQSRDELVALRAAMMNLQANLAKHIEMRKQQEQQIPSAFRPGASSFGGGGIGAGPISTFGGGGGGGASSFFGGGGSTASAFPPVPTSFGDGGSGHPQFVDGSTAYGGGVGGPNVFQSFPAAPRSFGDGGNGFSQFAGGSNAYGGGVGGFDPAFSTGLNYSGGGVGGFDPAFSTGLNYSGGGVGGAFPFSTGQMFPQFPTGSSFLGGAGALPFSTWSSSVGGSLSSFSGPNLPPFPDESVPFPPGMSSFGRGGALPIPPALGPFGYGLGRAGDFRVPASPSGRGGGWGMGSNLSDLGGGGDMSMGPSPSGRGGASHVGPILSRHGGGGGGAALYVGPYSRGGGRGPRPGSGRGSNRGHGQGFQ